MTDISPHWRALTDRTAIIDTVIAYATALDSRNWAGLGALFTEDARWAYDATAEVLDGPPAIVARVRAAIESLDATQHLNGNHVVEIHGDEAEHTCYFHAQHIRRGLPGGDLFLAGGTYRDRLRRTGDGWRFVSREIGSGWADGNPAVLGIES